MIFQLFMAAFVLPCGFSQNQEKPAPTSSETVVVSAGIPDFRGEQPRRERSGNSTDAMDAEGVETVVVTEFLFNDRH